MSRRRLSPNRRAFLQSAAAAGILAATGARAQENWPTRTVKIIVPYPAGGSTDVLTRILAEKMQQMTGQSFVVENRPGAGGNIGTATMASSAPDGYTIGSIPINIQVINQYLYKKMPLDPEKDVVSASLTWELPDVFVVASDHVPAKTLQEFLAWAKGKQLNFGSPGVGTTPHLAGAYFVKRTGIAAIHVPFKGAAQTIPAMLAGDITFAIDNLASYVGMIESGKMRALAVTSKERWPTMKDVPTMAEAGISDFVVTSWASIEVPARTPRLIVNKLSAMMQKIAADPALQQRFLKAGARCIASTPEAAAAYAAKERVMWKEMVNISGAKPQ
ncbi:MAG TPA: tripartite tricarboxylate transporter substrate binding protein [Pseudolabrys sp.]|nr:tripartite tricarboxylate transporter substrate binding protein [Pseudolabrys sp.]